MKMMEGQQRRGEEEEEEERLSGRSGADGGWS